MKPQEQLDVSLFNNQPHINTAQNGLKDDPKHSSDRFTFMLRHKHFDLGHGEVLWVERVSWGYKVSVKKQGELQTGALPCMWLHNKSWKPFGYTGKIFGWAGDPDVPPGDYNIGLRWLNFGGVENTNDIERTQIVTNDPAVNREKGIITMRNWVDKEESACSHVCIIHICINC